MHNFRSTCIEWHTHPHKMKAKTRTLPHNVLIASLVGALLQASGSKRAQQAIVNLTQAFVETGLVLLDKRFPLRMSNTTTNLSGSRVKQ